MKTMNTLKIIVITILCFFMVNVGCSGVIDDSLQLDKEVNVSIDRVDMSVKNSEGFVLAIIYYDLLSISGDSDAHSKINTFFNEAFHEWLTGSSSLGEFQYLTRMQGSSWLTKHFFASALEEMLHDGYDESYLIAEPMFLTFDTEVTFLSQDILSIKQTYRGYRHGPIGSFWLGTTFDLNTGERMSLNDLVDVDADLFRGGLADFLVNLIDPSLSNLGSTINRTREFYGPNSSHDFNTYLDGNLYRIDYEFFYDGESIYIPEATGLHRLPFGASIKCAFSMENNESITFLIYEGYIK